MLLQKRVVDNAKYIDLKGLRLFDDYTILGTFRFDKYGYANSDDSREIGAVVEDLLFEEGWIDVKWKPDVFTLTCHYESTISGLIGLGKIRKDDQGRLIYLKDEFLAWLEKIKEDDEGRLNYLKEKRQKITELIRRLSDCQIEREASINMGNPDAGKPIRKVWLPKPEFNQWGDLTPRSAREIGSKVELLLYQEGYLLSQCKRTDVTEYYNEVVRKARELGKITAAEDGTWRYKRDG